MVEKYQKQNKYENEENLEKNKKELNIKITEGATRIQTSNK